MLRTLVDLLDTSLGPALILGLHRAAAAVDDDPRNDANPIDSTDDDDDGNRPSAAAAANDGDDAEGSPGGPLVRAVAALSAAAEERPFRPPRPRRIRSSTFRYLAGPSPARSAVEWQLVVVGGAASTPAPTPASGGTP